MSQPTRTTLVFPRRDQSVLLGMKQRGFGEGWWNGVGGKNDPDERFEDCARREAEEEVGIVIGKLQPVARLLFYFEDKLEISCAAYTTNDFTGEPEKREEMDPAWFHQSFLPFEQMWPCDRDWIPQALELKPGDPTLDLAIYFDAAKNYLKKQTADPTLIAEHFEKP